MGASSGGNQISFPCCYNMPVRLRAWLILGVAPSSCPGWSGSWSEQGGCWQRSCCLRVGHGMWLRSSCTKAYEVLQSPGPNLDSAPCGVSAGAAVLWQPSWRGWEAAGTVREPPWLCGCFLPPASRLQTASAQWQPWFVQEQADNPTVGLGLLVLHG